MRKFWVGGSPRRRAAGRLCVAIWAFVVATSAAAVAQGAGFTPPPCTPFTYHSAPTLHAQRVCMNLNVVTHATAPGTYLFTTPGQHGAGIFADNGTLVWWHPSASPLEYDLSAVTYQGQRYLALWSGGGGRGRVTLYNNHYQIVGHITAGAGLPAESLDLHEFQLTPQGTALISIYNPVWRDVNGHWEWVMDWIVRKISLVHDATGIHTGRVLFQWDSLRDVPLSDSYAPDPGANGTWDYFHGNAITQDSDGNLVVSSRNTWGIYKLDDIAGTSRYGHVIWQLGSKHGPRIASPWCYQHSIRALGNNEYSLYDDGGSGPGCSHPARALIISVTPTTSPVGVHLISAFPHNPAVYNYWVGGAQVLPDHDMLVDWGSTPLVTEYSSTGQVNMDLSLSNWSYRTERFPWDGVPLGPPAVDAYHSPTGTDVWMSWNGSTEVTAWRVLAGPSAKQLAPVTGTIAKQSFETPVSLNARYAWVAVQALNAAGQVLTTSRATAVAG